MDQYLHIPDAISELTYASYKFQRDTFPEIAAARWGLLFTDAEAMEARYIVEARASK